MTTRVCPLFEDAFYSYTIDLSGDTYTLTFRYSERADNWLMNIEDAEENVLIRGVKLVPYYPLLQQYALDNPPGDFVLAPISDSGIADSSITTPRDINKTHILFYTDEV